MDDDLLLSVGSRGRGKGEFINPQGVCVTSDGDILVCDSNTQCVQVLSYTHHTPHYQLGTIPRCSVPREVLCPGGE